MVSFWIHLTIGVIVALIALGAVAINTALEHGKLHIVTTTTLFNHDPFLGSDSVTLRLKGPTDLEDVDGMFLQVLSALEDEITVYPSENYLYFRLDTSGENVWGSILLSKPELDKGFVHFAYFKFNENPQGPSDFLIKHRKLGPDDGAHLVKENDFRYILSYRDEEVIFNLNEIDQSPPRLFELRPDEVWVLNSRDESGLNFHLIYDTKTTSFFWLLNEEEHNQEEWIMLNDKIMLGKRTGFVFYVDEKQQERKILIGAKMINMRQNNYYDGPFDQLADNYITKEHKLSKYIQEAYPDTKGLIDEYGRYIENEEARVAIAPYFPYSSLDEVLNLVDRCTQNQEQDFYACITTNP